MQSPIENIPTIKVRGTEILPTDTTQRYREKLARITLDSMVQFVGLLDAKGTVLEINKVALDAVGIKLSDVEGKPFWTSFWWQVSPEINSTLRDSIARAAKGEFVRWDAEIYGRASGKETIIIDASLCPVMDDDGNVVFIAAEGRDITEKKAYEREIAKKNKDLQTLLERIRELDEIKTQFFANVSHELRTPLQLIIGPADRLIRNDATMNSQQRQESAKVITRNARMLLKHVNDLLDISKLEAGKLKIEPQDTNVAALLRLTASHFEVLAAERKISLLIEAGRSVVGAIDPEKIQRVLMNLLSNAFKFVPNGGTVRATIQLSKKDLILSIDDSGPGVKPELRKAIFERFRQGEGGASRQFGGTGLGLAIAKEFVEMHQGTLEVLDSELGGACFQITLPMDRLSPSSSASIQPPIQDLDSLIIEGFIEELRPNSSTGQEIPAVSGKSPRPTVLIVEDNMEMNQFIAQSLAEEYNIVAAFDGEQGLAKAQAINPTLIVTDIMMPKLSGAQMIAEIRKCAELNHIPILLLSAKADEELKVKLLETGAQDFVSKPFSEKDLLVRIRNLIKLRKSQEEIRHYAEELKRSNKDLEQFASIASHDLQEPLRVISGYAQLLQRKYKDKLDQPGQEFTEYIIESVSRMTALIHDLLAYSQVRRQNKFKAADLTDICRQAIRNLAMMIKENEAKISCEALPRLIVDEALMTQLFQNLINNAIKFRSPQTIPEIQVAAKSEGDNWIFTVKDNGIGIAPEHHERIFEIFRRLHAQSEYPGTGIGLALCKRIVEFHKGKIWVESEYGKGTTFYVSLPKEGANHQ